jgi:hypothetical protein
MFLFEWFASSALLWIITKDGFISIGGGFVVALFSHIFSDGKQVVVVKE